MPQTKLQGEYTSPTQPVPTFFKPYVRQRLTEADLFKDGISEESYRDLLERFRSLDNDNMWNPPSARGTIQNPGLNGGGEWGGPAFDPETEILYINANESPWVIGPRIADEQNSIVKADQSNEPRGRKEPLPEELRRLPWRRSQRRRRRRLSFAPRTAPRRSVVQQPHLHRKGHDAALPASDRRRANRDRVLRPRPEGQAGGTVHLLSR